MVAERGGWTSQFPAAKWANMVGGRRETEGAADAERGVTPPSGPLRGGFAGGYAAAEKSAAAAEKVSAAAEKRTAVAKSGGCGGEA